MNWSAVNSTHIHVYKLNIYIHIYIIYTYIQVHEQKVGVSLRELKNSPSNELICVRRKFIRNVCNMLLVSMGHHIYIESCSI